MPIETDKQLAEGPWYWVYLRPKWKLFAAPAASQDESLGHADFWADQITPIVADFYSIAGRDRRRIANAPYGMPRGRVCRIMRRGDVERHTVVYFGDDMPKALNTPAKRAAIQKQFNASEFIWLTDEHERMQLSDRTLLAELLGLPT